MNTLSDQWPQGFLRLSGIQTQKREHGWKIARLKQGFPQQARLR
jgi:hypothetical protein